MGKRDLIYAGNRPNIQVKEACVSKGLICVYILYNIYIVCVCVCVRARARGQDTHVCVHVFECVSVCVHV
jgi:hypothetical protein